MIFLNPLPCRKGKSILQLSNKAEFETQIELISKEIKKCMKALPEILQDKMFDTKERLLKELLAYFLKNIPAHLINHTDKDRQKRAIENYTKGIIESIRFPDPHKLVKKMKVQKLYYDLTWLDYSDKKLLEEFKEKKILAADDLKDILQLNDAFQIKK